MRARRDGDTPGRFWSTSGIAETGTPATLAMSRMVGRTLNGGCLQAIGLNRFGLDTVRARSYRKPRTSTRTKTRTRLRKGRRGRIWRSDTFGLGSRVGGTP